MKFRSYQSRPAKCLAFQFRNLDDLLGNSISHRKTDGGILQMWVANSRAWCNLVVGDWIIKEPSGMGFYRCDNKTFQTRWDVPMAGTGLLYP